MPTEGRHYNPPIDRHAAADEYADRREALQPAH
jgi:hypothetical protein